MALACATIISGWLPAVQFTSRAQAPDLIEGFEGVYSTGIPADPSIAAGPHSLVTMVMGKIAIFRKDGTQIFEQILMGGVGLWGPTYKPDFPAEPWVIFDPHSQRFIASVTEFGTGKGYLYLAVSKSDNPTSSSDWHKYRIDRTGTHQGPNFPGVPTYPDYAKVGVDSDAIYITAGHFAKDLSITGNFSHVEIFALEKAPMLSGGAYHIVYDEPVITESYSEPFPFSIHPAVVHDPGAPMCFVQSLTRRTDDKIIVHTWSNVLSGSPDKSAKPVEVALFNRPPNVPQLGYGIALENIDARLMSAVVRNGSLWTTHAVQDPTAGSESVVRWYEIDVSQPDQPVLAQSGNVVPPNSGEHTWLPSINVDVDSNMGLCFSVGGPNRYAAIGYTGRLATDPQGQTWRARIARAGSAAFTQGGWGEHSGLAMDPNDYTFWLCHQYPVKAKGTGTWRTYVAAFEVAPPPPPADPLHIGDLDGSSSGKGKTWNAAVTATVHDGSDFVLEGARVFVQWSTGASANGLTDANGRVTFSLDSINKQVTTVSLTITGVTYPGLNYSVSDNHDPEADSNGTSIVVKKP